MRSVRRICLKQNISRFGRLVQFKIKGNSIAVSKLLDRSCDITFFIAKIQYAIFDFRAFSFFQISFILWTVFHISELIFLILFAFFLLLIIRIRIRTCSHLLCKSCQLCRSSFFLSCCRPGFLCVERHRIEESPIQIRLGKSRSFSVNVVAPQGKCRAEHLIVSWRNRFISSVFRSYIIYFKVFKNTAYVQQISVSIFSCETSVRNEISVIVDRIDQIISHIVHIDSVCPVFWPKIDLNAINSVFVDLCRRIVFDLRQAAPHTNGIRFVYIWYDLVDKLSVWFCIRHKLIRSDVNNRICIESRIRSLCIIVKNFLDLRNRSVVCQIKMIDQRVVVMKLIAHFQFRPDLCKWQCMRRNVDLRNNIHSYRAFVCDKFLELFFCNRVIFRSRTFSCFVCQSGFKTKCLVRIKRIVFRSIFSVFAKPDIVIRQMRLKIIHLIITHRPCDLFHHLKRNRLAGNV